MLRVDTRATPRPATYPSFLVRGRRRSTPGSIYCPKGRQTLSIKLSGVVISTGYKDTPQGRLRAQEELERMYEGFRADYAKTEGATKKERFQYWLSMTNLAGAPQGLTCKEAFQEFIRQHGRQRRAKTVQNYKHAYDALIGEAVFPVASMVMVGSQSVLRLEHQIEKSLLARVRGPVTLSNYVRAISVWVRWLFDMGHIDNEVRLGRLRRLLVQPKPKKIAVFSESETALLIERMQEKHPDGASLVRFLLATGMRIHEAMELEWSDVDYERGIIACERKDGVVMQYVVITKEVDEILEGQRSRHPEKPWPWKTGKLSHVRRWMREAARGPEPKEGEEPPVVIDLTGRSFHTFRKTFISRLVDRIGRDMDVWTVAKLARARVEVIQNHYLSVPTENLRAAMERMR